MKCIAALARAAKAPSAIEPIDVPEPAEDDVLVRIVGSLSARRCQGTSSRNKARKFL